MNWVSHSVITLFLAVIAVFLWIQATDPTINVELIGNCIAFILIAGLASLVPDLDLPDSKFSRLLEATAALVIAVGVVMFFGLTETALFLGVGIFLLFKILYAIVVPRHRGFVHSLIFLGLSTIGVHLIVGIDVVTIAYFFGFFSHLVFDGCGLKIK